MMIKITAKNIIAKLVMPNKKINTKTIARPIVPAINNAEKNITRLIKPLLPIKKWTIEGKPYYSPAYNKSSWAYSNEPLSSLLIYVI